MTTPTGRDPLAIHQEIIDETRRQVAAAISESDALQREQAAWMDAGLPARKVGSPQHDN
jgi:hypothetical protein